MIEQQYEDIHYLQFDHLQQFPELIHGVFTRKGGYSEGPYKGLNASAPPRARGGGDSPENVTRNRQLALRALGMEAAPCVNLWQVHGAEVVTMRLEDEWRTDWADLSYYEPGWTPQSIRKGDALLTQERRVSLALAFADCVPITLYDPVQQVIGIAHGGWRGTARGIVIATIEEMQARFGSQPKDIYAGIAPAIGPCCYEVSQDVQDFFYGQQQFSDIPVNERYRAQVRESAAFSAVELPEKTSLRLDLQITNQRQLLMAGLHPDHVEIMRICTGCHTDLFFSHRKENGLTGRFVVIMALNAAESI